MARVVRKREEIHHSAPKLLLSCMVAFITMLFVNSIFTALIIKPRLYDGSVNELGRYSMTFDAYEYISKNI